MYQYDPSEWLLFFYFYCFCGWVWECCYVSVRQKKWVNRGFLHGPFLPIYGSGAICVLIMTIPVKDNLPAVFFMGMFGATVLEYFTGVVMERLFGVRYWDYSNMPLNLHGHICLIASIGWGFFSVMMIQVVQLPVERMVYAIPDAMRETLAIFITVIFVVDFTKSFQEAMDLKELMVRLTEGNEEIQRLQKRMDVLIAVLNEETDGLREKAEEGIRRYTEFIKEYKEKTEEKRLEKMAVTEEKWLERKAVTEEKRLERKAVTEEKRLERKAVTEEKRLERKAVAEERRLESMAVTEEKQLKRKAAAEEKRLESIAVAEEKRLEKKTAQEEGLERYRQRKAEWIEAASRFTNNLTEQLLLKKKEQGTSENEEKLEAKLDKELEGMQSSIRKLRNVFELNRKKELASSGRILRRNPGAFSKKYAEALKEVQEMDKENREV